MTYARLRDILSMLTANELNQEAVFLINNKLEKIDYIDSFRGDKNLANKFNGQSNQIFLTNNKEL
jgi:hypothetical protein